MARQLRAGRDATRREAELEELEKKWAAEKARVTKQWPSAETGAETAPSSFPSQETNAAIQDEAALGRDDPLAKDDFVTGQHREKQDSRDPPPACWILLLVGHRCLSF